METVIFFNGKEFVKEVVCVLNKGRQFMDQRLKVVVNEVGHAFSGMAIR